MDLNGVARWVGLGRWHVAVHDQLYGCLNSEGPPDEGIPGDTCSGAAAEMLYSRLLSFTGQPLLTCLQYARQPRPPASAPEPGQPQEVTAVCHRARPARI